MEEVCGAGLAPGSQDGCCCQHPRGGTVGWCGLVEVVDQHRLMAHKFVCHSGWRQQLGILGILLYVTVVIVLRYKMSCLLS